MYMSSDSEVEEFFDAEEATPTRSARSDSGAGSQPGLRKQSPTDLEAEERRLQDLKRQSEERRRKEDDELQRKMAELELKKQRERERVEAEKKAHEGETRRKRLEEMRRKLAEETTPKPPQKPPRLFLDKKDGAEQEVASDMDQQEGHQHQSQDASNTNSKDIECNLAESVVSNTSEDKHENSTNKIEASISSIDDKKHDNESKSVIESAGESSVCRNVETNNYNNTENNININRSEQSEEKMQTKIIPDSTPTCIESENAMTEIINEDEIVTEVVSNFEQSVSMHPEPDIIQITKATGNKNVEYEAPSSEQNCESGQQAVPVAPPRRKKKKVPTATLR